MKIDVPGGYGQLAFLTLWTAMFAGIPLFILITADSDLGATLFLSMFVLVGVGVFAAGIVKFRRRGFALHPDGVHGAHASEDRVVPWERIKRVSWEETTERRRRDNRTYTVSGSVLYAHLHDGRNVRLTQDLITKYGWQEQINEQILTARGAGIVPETVDLFIGEFAATPLPPPPVSWPAATPQETVADAHPSDGPWTGANNA